MDRRSFLSRLGIGAAATVTTQLWLPPVSTAVAQPERRVFVPPRGGWGLQPSGQIKHRFTVGYIGHSGIVEVAGDTQSAADMLIDAGAVDQELTLAISPADLRSLFMLANDGSLIIETEGPHGREIIRAPQDVPFVAGSGFGRMPFKHKFDRLLISNPGPNAATFHLRALS